MMYKICWYSAADQRCDPCLFRSGDSCPLSSLRTERDWFPGYDPRGALGITDSPAINLDNHIAATKFLNLVEDKWRVQSGGQLNRPYESSDHSISKVDGILLQPIVD